MTVNPIPKGYHSVTPYLVVEDVASFLEFTKQAFGAEETECIRLPDGSIMHAEVKIGDSPIMMGGTRGERPALPSMLYLYVADCDAAYARAIEAGATSVREPEDQFYGDRSAGVTDPFGVSWWFGTRVEEVSPEEMSRRMAVLQKES